MAQINQLKQYYYCNVCDDFYEERTIVLNFQSYLTATLFRNIGNCPRKHQRSINNEDIVYLSEKPNRNSDSSIICLDIKDFSKKNQISQFNNVSVLYAACGEIIATDFALAIYKG